ncbi:hypothetical protein P8C59_008890 [Phyllachora maydis]|uniref:Uncharacterized protein n=1 Tax=Phyllachora maydis TaxID=1825666 RepID=A0AAD9IBE3_9PEZI|nr:hypothetical protein P8C59_008890 [Phyllachora maydis]
MAPKGERADSVPVLYCTSTSYKRGVELHEPFEFGLRARGGVGCDGSLLLATIMAYVRAFAPGPKHTSSRDGGRIVHRRRSGMGRMAR